MLLGFAVGITVLLNTHNTSVSACFLSLVAAIAYSIFDKHIFGDTKTSVLPLAVVSPEQPQIQTKDALKKIKFVANDAKTCLKSLSLSYWLLLALTEFSVCSIFTFTGFSTSFLQSQWGKLLP